MAAVFLVLYFFFGYWVAANIIDWLSFITVTIYY
jgi:hypothetical protein